MTKEIKLSLNEDQLKTIIDALRVSIESEEVDSRVKPILEKEIVRYEVALKFLTTGEA